MNPATVSTERRWRCWMPGKTRGMADDLADRRGCTVPQLMAQLLLDEADRAGIGGVS